MCVEVFRKTQATLWRRPERAAPRSEAEPGLAPGLPALPGDVAVQAAVSVVGYFSL